MCGETDGVNSHFAQDCFFANLNNFVRVHDLFCKGSFDTVTCEYDTILFVWSPFQKQVLAKTTLEHTWPCHDNEWTSLILDLILGSNIELEWILTLLELQSNFI